MTNALIYAMAVVLILKGFKHCCFASYIVNSGRYHQHSRYRSVDGVLASYITGSSLRCGRICQAHAQCNSFNVRRVEDGASLSNRCELVKTDHNSMATISSEPDWTLYLSKHMHRHLQSVDQHFRKSTCICTRVTVSYTRICLFEII